MASKGAILSRGIGALLLLLLLSACTVSYGFTGGALDYSKVRTAYLADVVNMASRVYPPLAPNFTEAMREYLSNRTRLELVADNDADLILEITITSYDLMAMAVQESSLAEQTKVTLTMQVHYENKAFPDQSFDRSFTAFTDFPSSEQFMNVQDGLLKVLTEDLVKQIANATVENW